MTRPAAAASRRRRGRGFSLIDALIALALLSFGLAALTRFQGRLVQGMTDAQSRSTANRMADELIAMALVDPANLNCYTLPAVGACGNASARAATTAWSARATAALPGAATPTATVAGTRFTVVMGWTSKADSEGRQLTATTDVE